jgi:hypothetical protein
MALGAVIPACPVPGGSPPAPTGSTQPDRGAGTTRSSNSSRHGLAEGRRFPGRERSPGVSEPVSRRIRHNDTNIALLLSSSQTGQGRRRPTEGRPLPRVERGLARAGWRRKQAFGEARGRPIKRGPGPEGPYPFALSGCYGGARCGCEGSGVTHHNVSWKAGPMRVGRTVQYCRRYDKGNLAEVLGGGSWPRSRPLSVAAPALRQAPACPTRSYPGRHDSLYMPRTLWFYHRSCIPGGCAWP